MPHFVILTITAVLINLGAASRADENFNFNLSYEQFLRLDDEVILLKDLSVGEKISIHSSSICLDEDGTLNVDVYARRRAEDRPSWRKITATRLANHRVSLTYEAPKEGDNKMSGWNMLPHHNPCPILQYRNYPTVPDYYKVITVNGFSNLKAYLAHLRSSGYKFK